MGFAELYGEFDPLRPLGADEGDLYVDWQERLSADDVKPRLVHSVSRAGSPVFRLFTGHRGSGKTTELYRVRRRLERGDSGRKFFVSMLFSEHWLALQDVQAEDVVFQIVRQLVTDLRAAGFGLAEPALRNWWGRFRDLFRSEVKVEGIDLGEDPLKVSLALEAFPSGRREFRQLLQGQLPSMYNLVNNELLRPARQWLGEHGSYSDVVVIVDQLDRIPQKVLTNQGLTNHENLFLDNAGPLRALECSVLYTIPIELAYSLCRPRLEDEYGNEIFTLPTIPVWNRRGQLDSGGLQVLREIVARRAKKAGVPLEVLFDPPDLLDTLLIRSSGHLRGAFVLLTALLSRIDGPPIREPVVSRTIRRAASDLSLPLRDEDWNLLRQVHATKKPLGSDQWWNDTLKNRFVFAYEDQQGYWYDSNGLLAFVEQVETDNGPRRDA
jgi:hypothetical protein